MLEALNCIIWVDDVIYWGLDETDLLNMLNLILERLEEVGLYVAAHKCTFLETSITWCGKVYSQGEIKCDPERLAGLLSMSPRDCGRADAFLAGCELVAHVFAANG